MIWLLTKGCHCNQFQSHDMVHVAIHTESAFHVSNSSLVGQACDEMHVPAGNMLFHGPREEVVPFFQSQGFFVPERKAVSDFLQEVTSKKDQKVSPDASYLRGSWVICLPSSLLCAAILQAQELGCTLRHSADLLI